MSEELLKVGKYINDVKLSLKKEKENRETQSQTQQEKPESQEEKVPNTKVKDQYDANDEIYYEKNDGTKNTALFVGYSQEKDDLVNLKPTQGGDVFAVNKDKIIGAVVKESQPTQEGVLTYDKFILLKENSYNKFYNGSKFLAIEDTSEGVWYGAGYGVRKSK